MAPELQKRRVTEIKVRMDCNGCVQKIKKILNGINGIHDLHIDVPQQKLTITGSADPETIIQAIRRTRKIATICSRSEPMESPSQPPEQAREENSPAPDATQQLPAETPPAQAGPRAKPAKDSPEVTALPTENSASQQSQSTPGTQDLGEVEERYHHRPNYENRNDSGHSYVGEWDRYHSRPVFVQEPSPPIVFNVTHSYNTYNPSPYVTAYEYVRSPKHTPYSGDYHNYGNGNFTSMFSDENPNACSIV